MIFIIKAIIQQILSALPRSETLNYFFQRNVTKNLPISDDLFKEKIEIAHKHFSAFVKYCPSVKPADAKFYEFGAGWDLCIPLAYYCFGINHQTIIDIRPNVKFELVNNTIQRLSKHKREIENLLNMELRTIEVNIHNTSQLREMLGIRWHAPIDSRNTGLPPESFDFISNTATLEHIPKDDLEKTLRECHRILKKNGIMCCAVDLKDHFSYFDKSISHYNFLKYSDKLWYIFNPKIHYQNRLRYPDYINLFNSTGLEIIELEAEKPDEKDIEILKKTKLTREFKDKFSL